MTWFLHISNEDACKESSDTGKSHAVRSSLTLHEHLLFAPSVSPIATLQIPSIPAPVPGLNSLAPAVSLLCPGKPPGTHSASAGAEQPSFLTASSQVPSRKRQAGRVRMVWRNWQTAITCFPKLQRRLALALSHSHCKARTSAWNNTWSTCCPWSMTLSLADPPLLH